MRCLAGGVRGSYLYLSFSIYTVSCNVYRKCTVTLVISSSHLMSPQGGLAPSTDCHTQSLEVG